MAYRCEICGGELYCVQGLCDWYLDDDGYRVEVCPECHQKHMEKVKQERAALRKQRADDSVVFSVMNRIAVLNGLLVKEKAEKAKIERKYNRYYHLVGDFYAYLLKIDKVKEFTAFHEEKEIEREAKSDGRTQDVCKDDN